MIRTRWQTSFVALALLTSSTVAQAESHDAAAAEALFDEGRSLMKSGRFAEACSKFEASQRLDPGVGTLLNLGDCLEHAGRTASAWARFREAASLAVAASQSEREQAARARAQALEGHLVRLSVRPDAAAAQDDALRITRDGIILERQTWGTAVPVDPGKHVVVATSPGKASWSKTIELTAEGKTEVVEIPALAKEAGATVSSSSWSTQRAVALVTGGFGLVALGVGGIVALDAKSSYDEAKVACTPSGCPDGARARANSAGETADIATGFFIGGALTLAVGVVLFATAATRSSTSVTVGLRKVVPMVGGIVLTF